jgi:hypothetical protein
MDRPTNRQWTPDDLLALSRTYQGAAVLAAAADLDLFDPLAQKPRTASTLASDLGCDQRALTILLDALASLELLHKNADRYSLAPGVAELLTPHGSKTVLAMLQHQANCLRRWSDLARVVKTGRPAARMPSVRGESGDQEAFIRGMHNLSAPVADEVIRALDPLSFRHLLDLGGASGTWTMAFLRAVPSAHATLFDLPPVIPLARQRLIQAGFADRVTLVAGNFMADSLPRGADFAWVSAIVHQNSREQNRALFARVFHALRPGGRIAIRDILMRESRTQPVAGALFAVNMLVATEGGGTFTPAELTQDLESGGFNECKVVRQDDAMNSVLVALKPG